MKKRFLAIVMSACAVLAVPAQAAAVKDGVAAWQAGDYEKAIAIWTPLANGGDADAAFNLGQAYRLGRGTPVDVSNARKWFERAAQAGHLDAQANLGLLLFQAGDQTGAMKWLKVAADAGEPRAMLIYGTALFNGDGVPRDAVAAYAFVSRSAAKGLAPAKSTLSDLDSMMPLEARMKGIELAKTMVGTVPAKKSASGAASAKARAAAAPAKSAVSASAPDAKSAKPGGTGWRLQLGAFASRAAAEQLFARLKASAPVAGHSAAYVQAGKVVRLQVGPFGKDEAGAACKALAARGQACFPVKAS